MKRTIDFRYVIVRNGADYATIRPVKAPTIRMRYTSKIKTSLSGEFLEPEADVNWLTDAIRPEIIIDGVATSLGVFLPATVSRTETATTKSLKVEAYDRCWVVRDNYTETRISIAAGVNYISAIQTLLTTCGIYLTVATPTNATITEIREDWDVGTSYLDIINQLLSEINYHELWFDKAGYAVLEPVSTPTAANIEHTLDDTNVKSLLLPQMTAQTDVYSAPNVFIVVCSNPDKDEPMIATAENTNPQSPLSVDRRGRSIVKFQTVNNIASQAELQEYANTLRNNSMIRGETIEVTTGLFPGYGVNDVTAIRYGGLFSVCLERQWQMKLEAGGDMKHTLERVVINLG